MPAKLSAWVRVFATGQGRETDPVDAHSVAVVALRAKGLRFVQVDDATVALRLLVDHRDELGHARTQVVNRLHRLLFELLAGGAKKFLSATQARALLSSVRPRDVVGRTRRRPAADLITELDRIDKRIKTANAELGELVASTGSTLLELFASWNGTAPLEASYGDRRRHRLSRAGNRRINRVLHVVAIVQLRHDTPGRACYRRRLAEGKTSMEAMRCLKRRLSDVVYRRMVGDAERLAAGSGGHSGAAPDSSAADLNPVVSTSEQSLPEPADYKDRAAASSSTFFCDGNTSSVRCCDDR